MQFLTYFKFSPQYSLSINFVNCSRPIGSFNNSRRSKPQRLTRRNGISLLEINNKKHTINKMTSFHFVVSLKCLTFLALTNFFQHPIIQCYLIAKDLANQVRLKNSQILYIAQHY